MAWYKNNEDDLVVVPHGVEVDDTWEQVFPGEDVPPFLELGQFLRKDNKTFCFRENCEGCKWEPTCERSETVTVVGPGMNIRRAILAAPGYLLAAIDYSGIELRLAAEFSREPLWVEAFIAGKDLHAEMACVMFGVAKPTSKQRKDAKVGNFNLLYLGGPSTIRQKTRCSEEEALAICNSWWEAVPDYEKWTRKQWTYARQHRGVRTSWGRFRNMEELLRIAELEDAVGVKGRKKGTIFAKRTSINCLDDSTVLTTTHRQVEIGEMFKTGKLPGERIWNGRSAHDFRIHDAGYKEVWEVEFHSGAKLRASADHLIKIYKETPFPSNFEFKPWHFDVAKLVLELSEKTGKVPIKRIDEELKKKNYQFKSPTRRLLKCVAQYKLIIRVSGGYSPNKELIDTYSRLISEREKSIYTSGESWVKISDLSVGDYTFQNDFCPPALRSLSDTERNHCELLGSATGDGSFTEKTKNLHWVFNKHERDHWEKTQGLLMDEGYDFWASLRDRRYDNREDMYEIKMWKGDTDDFIAKTGIRRSTSHHKIVPDYVLSRGPEAWKAFLKGYRTTDGQNQFYNQRISTASINLANGVFQLYQSMGLRPILRSYNGGSAWYVDTLDRIDASDLIGWNSKSKEWGDENQAGLCVPSSLASRVGHAVYDSEYFKTLKRDKQCHVHRLRVGSSSLTSLRHFAEQAGVAEKFPEIYYSFDQVVSVKRLGIQVPMKDIEILDGPNEFVANGLVVHNSVIQGTSADIMKLAMVNVNKWIEREGLFEEVQMLITVHDELVLQIRDDEHFVERAKKVSEIMCPPTEMTGWKVPILTDIEVGPNWSDVEQIDRFFERRGVKNSQKCSAVPRDGVLLDCNWDLGKNGNDHLLSLLLAEISILSDQVDDEVKVPMRLKTSMKPTPTETLDRFAESVVRQVASKYIGLEVSDWYERED